MNVICEQSQAAAATYLPNRHDGGLDLLMSTC